ncbi:hypothetical protein Pedsa_0807 [Pseudopedobacter saltans DSM 12145]|uniref:Glycosyl hydrolase-like 10 domain-containing protein n=1 Tax=Pseudopedobacter saltans (strain ATCC 51119 / DSM 12145 / JCM 21818 / CCUG 39354 / LMG 10337 / NBRC 100064 / NCIMB 13643) TaxID=762903 RepID=F0S981_PSESL|nr:hypothetical protein [Pseudopedobacter saltans]ADY51379.1 hypothetical protein Pedsa_0807 [Pseudopedobacter saltans DSM 12145]
MERRKFIKNAVLASAGTALLPELVQAKTASSKALIKDGKILNAYYFRAHTYTIVPRQVKEDLKWMADLGTNVVSVAVLEQDLFAAVENIQIICNEANKLGMKVFAVPSRWGGMFAGAPKVPSLFSVKNPRTWVLNKDGKPLTNSISGVISSIHYPETKEFFIEYLDNVFKTWDIGGIIWDEPKSFIKDYSKKAIENLGPNADLQAHVKATIDFYSQINKHIKTNYPKIQTSMFAYSNLSDMIVKEAAQTQYLDYYGCDGRPWRNEDGGQQEGDGKVLLGIGERYLKEAKNAGKKGLWLIENHNMQMTDVKLMDKRMQEVLSKDIDQLIYYYYPRNIENPEVAMNILAKHLKKFR